jgi:hypothetical protein
MIDQIKDIAITNHVHFHLFQLIQEIEFSPTF